MAFGLGKDWGLPPGPHTHAGNHQEQGEAQNCHSLGTVPQCPQPASPVLPFLPWGGVGGTEDGRAQTWPEALCCQGPTAPHAPVESTLCMEALGEAGLPGLLLSCQRDWRVGLGGCCGVLTIRPQGVQKGSFGRGSQPCLMGYFSSAIIKSSFGLSEIARYQSQMSARMVWLLRPGVQCTPRWGSGG